MTDSRNFPRSVKRAAYKRSGGRCENPSCRTPFPAGGGGVEYDHRIPWWISHDSSLGNCEVLCVPCHKKKTGSKDAKNIAKTRAIADAWIGATPRSTRPMAGGKNDWRKRKLTGEVVTRTTQAEEHRRVIAERQIGGGK